jgi:hypothetical protein
MLKVFSRFLPQP